MRGRSANLAVWGVMFLGVILIPVACFSSEARIAITVEPSLHGTVVPDRFLGMSFEPTDVIRDPDIRLNKPEVFGIGNCLYNFMALLQPGHIRIGGLLGDAPQNLAARDPTHIEPLLAFARDLDWIVDWTLRFVPYDPEGAVPTIAYIREHGSDLLRFVAIGTEPENYIDQQRRLEGWGVVEHCVEFSGYVDVLREAFPDLAIYGPNMVGDPYNMRAADGWIRKFAVSLAPELDGLAVHLYPLSWFPPPEDDLKSSLRTLLSASTRADTLRVITDAVSLAEELGLDLWISETSAGPDSPQSSASWGYFNKVASALNMLDNLFLMAEAGVQGAAIHVGGKTWWHMAPVQMGNWGTASSPSRRFPCLIRPLAYAMLLFSVSDPAQFVSCSTDRHDANVYSYAFTNGDGLLSVVIINKEVDQGFDVTLDFGTASSSARAITLEGDWWDQQATLGGARIQTSGAWTPTWTSLEPSAGKLALPLVAATAVLVVFD